VTEEDLGPRIRVELHGEEPQIGARDAVVTIIAFTDYECGFCARAEAPLHAAQGAFGDDVRILYKHMPMPRHPGALPAARLAWAAHRQGRFFDLHPLLFDAQGDVEEMFAAARRIGLDMARLQADVLDEAAESALAADFLAGSRAGVTGTPTFFVNGHRYVGVRDREAWLEVLEYELAEARRTAAEGSARPRGASTPAARHEKEPNDG